LLDFQAISLSVSVRIAGRLAILFFYKQKHDSLDLDCSTAGQSTLRFEQNGDTYPLPYWWMHTLPTQIHAVNVRGIGVSGYREDRIHDTYIRIPTMSQPAQRK
jgi:hypothetical protein